MGCKQQKFNLDKEKGSVLEGSWEGSSENEKKNGTVEGACVRSEAGLG